jgi:hypothetical protein
MGGQRAFSADAATPFAGAYWRLGTGDEDCSATCAMYAGCVAQAFSLTTLADMQSILGSAGFNSTFCTPTARFGQSTRLACRILQSEHSVCSSINSSSYVPYYAKSSITNITSKCYYGGVSDKELALLLPWSSHVC